MFSLNYFLGSFNYKKIFSFLIFFILAIILSDGATGGDENTILIQVNNFIKSQGNYFFFLLDHNLEFLDQKPNLLFFTHHLVVTQLINYLASITNLNIHPLFFSWLISFPLSFYSCISILIAYKALRMQGFCKNTSMLSVFLFFLGSNAIGLLTGGFIECMMLFLIALNLYFFEKLDKYRHLTLSIIHFLLILSKAYSCIFIILILPITLKKIKKELRPKYLILLLLGAILSIFLKLNNADLVDNYANFSINKILINFKDSIFSFDFGLIWTTIIISAYLTKKNINFYLFAKTFAVLMLMLSLCVFPFWHGAEGMVGQRYITPFLLIFLPNIAKNIEFISISKYKFCLFSIPIFVILYFPSVDYRNSLSSAYAITYDSNKADDFFFPSNYPHYDLSFHPAVFGWRILLTKKEETIRIASSRNLFVNKKEIMPQTGISRIIHIRNSYEIKSERKKEMKKIFSHNFFIILEFLKFFITFFVVSFILFISSRVVFKSR